MKKHFPVFLGILLICSLVTSSVSAADSVYPIGKIAGISAQIDGILVVELKDGESPAYNAGIRKGDIIREVNQTAVTNVQSFQEIIKEDKSDSVTVTVLRNGSTEKLTVHFTEEDNRELGVWLQERIYGLGTVTFLTEDGRFGALGHPISNGISLTPIPIKSGIMMQAELTGIQKGKKGNPGQLQGSLMEENTEGIFEKNTGSGIFGKIETSVSLMAFPVGTLEEAKIGKAEILSDVEGSDPKLYEIEITRILSGGNCVGREFSITVTSPELIALTGGIVQGMSGSPILQNGKLIGAVTHVLIDEPTKGYGIGIESMIHEAESADDFQFAA